MSIFDTPAFEKFRLQCLENSKTIFMRVGAENKRLSEMDAETVEKQIKDWWTKRCSHKG